MKANEAPEKIYLEKEKKLIKYIRTDAFIEKAKKWFEMQNEWVDLDGNYKCDMTDFEDFKKYIEGE